MSRDGEALPDLPKGWEWAKLDDIASIMKNQVIPLDNPNSDYNYLSIANIESDTGKLIDFKPTKGSQIKSAKLAFTTQDLLYSKLRPYLNKVHIPEFDGISATDLIPIRPTGEITREYLAYFLRNQCVLDYVNSRMRGIQLPRLPVNDLKALPVPIPPLPEQHRIVARIESLFQEVKTARENLEKVQPIINRFRQSVLAAAFRGELVEQNPEDESASVLLEKIKAERKKKLGKKYKEPEPVDGEGLPELPEGWEFVRLTTIVTILGDGLHGTPLYDESGEYYFINGNNLNDGKIEYRENTKNVSYQEYQKYNKDLNSRTVLVSINGTIGRVAFYNDEKVILGKSACYFNLHENVDKKYIKNLISSEYFLNYALSAATGSTIKNVSLRAMRDFPIPLPPLPEQHRIVARIEELFTLANQAEQALAESKKLADKMEQAILAKAFRGELVEQDPEDEPAGVLLERVKLRR